MALTPEAAARKDKTMPQGHAVMQHRHYVVIANIIIDLPTEGGFRARVAQEFADGLRGSNAQGRFDRKRFLTACGESD